MQQISNIGSGQAVVFLISDRIAPGRTRNTIELFIQLLKKNNEKFFAFAQNDGGVQVVFDYGVARKAKAETKFFLEIDGVFQDIEDTSDTLCSIFFPWFKATPATRCRIVINLTSTFKESSTGSQLASLTHEYFVHGIQYQDFITFIRANTNACSEVPFYYYCNAFEGKYLNGVEQHKRHGSNKSVSSSRGEEFWADYSGVSEYNISIQHILKVLDSQERRNLIEAAKTDIISQQKNAAADTAVDPPRMPAQITWQSIQKIKTVPGTFEVLFQHFALISCQVPDPAFSSSQSAIRATWENNFGQSFFPMVYAYHDYLVLRIGNLFGLSRDKMGQLVKTIPQWNYQPIDACLILRPQPRDIYEAWAEYYAANGYATNAGNCQALARELEHLFSIQENQRINAYILFRYRSSIHLNRLQEVDAWFKFAKLRTLL